jgi:L-lactate utilization protein LutB
MDPPAEANARLAEDHQEGIAMERALDSLEERFLGAHANLAMWQEMARRHRSVSEVACQNLSEHVRGMVRNSERQQGNTRNLKRRIASATSLGGGVATTSAKLRN